MGVGEKSDINQRNVNIGFACKDSVVSYRNLLFSHDLIPFVQIKSIECLM